VDLIKYIYVLKDRKNDIFPIKDIVVYALTPGEINMLIGNCQLFFPVDRWDINWASPYYIWFPSLPLPLNALILNYLGRPSEYECYRTKNEFFSSGSYDRIGKYCVLVRQSWFKQEVMFSIKQIKQIPDTKQLAYLCKPGTKLSLLQILLFCSLLIISSVEGCKNLFGDH
jgi:hypothetical protein